MDAFSFHFSSTTRAGKSAAKRGFVTYEEVPFVYYDNKLVLRLFMNIRKCVSQADDSITYDSGIGFHLISYSRIKKLTFPDQLHRPVRIVLAAD